MVEHLEVFVTDEATNLRPGGVTRPTPAEVWVSLDLVPDGAVHRTGWSLVVAYEIPGDRRASFGADALSLLYDENGWHVEGINYDEDPMSPG